MTSTQEHTARDFDTPFEATVAPEREQIGALHLSQCCLKTGTSAPLEDVPVSVVPGDGSDPTEGVILGAADGVLQIQTFDALPIQRVTIVPDATGFFATAAARLSDMAARPEKYTLGPAERLVPWLDPDAPANDRQPTPVTLAAFQTIWAPTLTDRRAALATAATELARANKRLLLIARSHNAADEMTAVVGRVLRAAGMTYRSLLSRYELARASEIAGLPLRELGFEAQMHQFYAQSRADKAALRRKYERFRELSPILVYKADKQKDLDEVRLLEWRLLTEITSLQDKIKDIDTTVAEYEGLPLMKRLAMQAVGRNPDTLQEYRRVYAEQIDKLKAEVDVAQERIAELVPEAAVPKDMRPEFEELKEEIVKLGGTKKIRELLAAEEGTNRQAFIQNKRIVIATARRVTIDPLFARVRFDALLIDEATDIPSSYLLACAGIAREKIILAGDPERIPPAERWAALP
ncbi:MAG TPA: AAA domain-containing protein [Nitrospirales bacterium]|nr:AAA domain-containing protein [Nitrospirales bacterium]